MAYAKFEATFGFEIILSVFNQSSQFSAELAQEWPSLMAPATSPKRETWRIDFYRFYLVKFCTFYGHDLLDVASLLSPKVFSQIEIEGSLLPGDPIAVYFAGFTLKV